MATTRPSLRSMPKYNDFIVYVDESGDHSLEYIDPVYPIFVLAFCVFEKERYATECIPGVIRFKFEQLGHDQFVLHERDIRKQSGAFTFLRDGERRVRFHEQLNAVIANAPFTIIAVTIDKRELLRGPVPSNNPYHIALEKGLGALHELLEQHGGCHGGRLHIVFERRGRREDNDLVREFQRACTGPEESGKGYPFAIVLADKRGNSTGLQLADLVARPLGLHMLRPAQPNRAWDILKGKLHRPD